MSIFLACSTISGEGGGGDFGFYLVLLLDNSFFVYIFNNDILAAIIFLLLLVSLELLVTVHLVSRDGLVFNTLNLVQIKGTASLT